jgi:hypothetical protein
MALRTVKCFLKLPNAVGFTQSRYRQWVGFGGDSIINIHNQHQWAEENPHGVCHSRHKQRLSINAWAGTVDSLVGLHVLPHQLTDFLLHELPKLMKNVPLAVRA